MTAFIRTWLLGIVCAAMLMAVTESLVQKEGVKRALKILGGLLLTLAVIRPIAGLNETRLEDMADEYGALSQEYREELQATQYFLYESIIAENAAAYILDKANELGMVCEATVGVAWDDEVPQLREAEIKGNWTQEQREQLSRIIEQDLGIPGSMQCFEEIGS